MDSKNSKDLHLGMRPFLTPTEIEAVSAAILSVTWAQGSRWIVFDQTACDEDTHDNQHVATVLLGHLPGRGQSLRLTVSLIGKIDRTLRLHLDVAPPIGVALQEMDTTQATERVNDILEKIATIPGLIGSNQPRQPI